MYKGILCPFSMEVQPHTGIVRQELKNCCAEISDVVASSAQQAHILQALVIKPTTHM